MDNNKSFSTTLIKVLRSFSSSVPILLSVILLFGLFRTFVSKQLIATIFTGDLFKDTLLGSIIGSISAGNPINSYIIGGELLKDNVNLFAVTAFIVAWVTVGLVQLPAESSILGKRFAIVRNGSSFILAILVAIATVVTLMVIR